ncbi:FAD-binding protein [Peribacillus frigoritolerans]|nr:FAD-binding protein [Peribacillus frigoritolerans]
MVIYPRDTAELRAVMGYANEHGIPVIPFGLGSKTRCIITPNCPGVKRKKKKKTTE